MALDIDTEANNENLDGLDVVAFDIDTEASNETEDFAVQFGLQKDRKKSNSKNLDLHFFLQIA
jgi:hypothetical protein